MKTFFRFISVSLVSAVMLGTFAMTPKAMADDDENGNASFSISAVSPHEFSPSQETAITITGTGFYSGLKVGIVKEGNEINSETGLTVLTSAYADVTQLTATVPAGLTAGEYNLYVYDPNQASFYFAKKEEALEGEVNVTSNTDTLGYSNSKAARKKMDVVFDGVALTKKRWVKVRMNGKNVPILKLIKTDANTTTLRLNVKYKGWAPGSYDLVMTYKKRVKTQYISKKGKVKYHKTWENGTVTASNFLTIVAD